MALTDLADLDLLDATLARFLPDEPRERFLTTYIQAFTNVVNGSFGTDLTPKDDEDMKALLNTEDVTPEKIEAFYKNRIPLFQEKLLLLTLAFKKQFLLDVYKHKLDEYQTAKDKEGYAAWEQIYSDAQNDNWNEVGRLLKVLEERYAPTQTPQAV